MKKNITIRDIAKASGVSASTVSRVINNSLPVKKETKNKILKAIKELNYHPDSLARSLRIGSSKTIGIIVPDISNPFFALLVKGAEETLSTKNYSTIICNSSKEIEDKKIIQLLLDKKVDGILYAGIGNMKNFEDINTPIIFIDRIEKDTNFSFVVSNNYIGMTELLEYLKNSNHKKYVFVSGNKNTFSSKERLRAFNDFINLNKFDSKIIQGNYTFESGIKIAKTLKTIPDAIVCANDIMAYGIIIGLKNRNLNVPKNVSVTGYDDIQLSSMFNPPLTTVRQPIKEIGIYASNTILNILSGKTEKKPVKMFKNNLIVRNSSKKRFNLGE